MCRSGDKWLVGEKGYRAFLKASVQGEEPNQPPTTGWKFYNWETRMYEEAPGLTCTIPTTSPSCCLTVSLSGRAKEIQGKCEGKYESTGMFSFGREVGVSSQTIWYKTPFCFQVFKLEVSIDCYLYIKGTSWSICSDLKGEKRYIRSGSAGLPCPGDPRNRNNNTELFKTKDWQFNKADKDAKVADWEKGGVVVKCTVHGICSDK